MKLSFEDVRRDARALGDSIAASAFAPDFIVGVARGGWIPSRLLSNVLGVKLLLSIGLAYRDASRTDLRPYQVPQPMPEGKRLLVVEDCLESGSSLKEAAKILSGNGNSVRTAALYITDKTQFEPDYYHQKYPSAPSFPWEKI